jgi:dihydropteroate synthase
MFQILELSDQEKIAQIMRRMDVDNYGIKIMSGKAISCMVKIDNLPCILANILKQEMLSLGADAAVSRQALTAKGKTTDCLLMGTLSQLFRLEDKLREQPLGLKQLGKGLTRALNNYLCANPKIELKGRRLNLRARTHIMGVLNITPDSFSSDGLKGVPVSGITDIALQLEADGADIIDVGGESSRPGARPVTVSEELKRVIPVIKALKKAVKVPISVDTYKPKVAEQALDNGAAMVNDITGLRDKAMARLCAKHKAGLVIMHMLKNPRTMQKSIRYRDLIGDIYKFLKRAVNSAEDSGVAPDKIIIDPGIGFGKRLEHNLEIINRLREFKSLGKPVLVGVSRKSFIGRILNTEPEDRLNGTLASCVLAAKNGAEILRAHDVRELKQALAVADAINRV